MFTDSVFIVGGGHSLERATAVELGRHGATVVVNDLASDVHGEGENVEPADETVAAVENAGSHEEFHSSIANGIDLNRSDRSF